MALHCCGPIPAFAPWLLLIAMCARNTFGNCGFQVPTLHSYADNIVALMSEADIDGALIGGASLDADSFISIVTQTAELAQSRSS
jgi:hypothetical protein